MSVSVLLVVMLSSGNVGSVQARTDVIIACVPRLTTTATNLLPDSRKCKKKRLKQKKAFRLNCVEPTADGIVSVSSESLQTYGESLAH